MPSASRTTCRVGVLAACVLLLALVVAGCQTTQDTAALKQAESKRILDARKHKQAKSHDHGSKKR